MIWAFIALALKRALDYRRHHRPTDGPPAMVSLRRDAIIGNSPRINACLEMVAHCAPIDVNVLITGETGNGRGIKIKVHYALVVTAEKSGMTKPGERTVPSGRDVSRYSKQNDTAGNDDQYKKRRTLPCLQTK